MPKGCSCVVYGEVKPPKLPRRWLYVLAGPYWQGVSTRLSVAAEYLRQPDPASAFAASAVVVTTFATGVFSFVVVAAGASDTAEASSADGNRSLFFRTGRTCSFRKRPFKVGTGELTPLFGSYTRWGQWTI